MKYEHVLKRANEIYAVKKLGSSAGFTAPEATPQIRSDQVKAVLEAVMEEMEGRLAVLLKELGKPLLPLTPSTPPMPPGAR